MTDKATGASAAELTRMHDDGLNYAQIAEQAGLSQDTVRSRIRRHRATLVPTPPPAPKSEAEARAMAIHKRIRDKVAIVGFASHWNQCDFTNPDYEIWGLNELYDIIPWQKARDEGRLRWFEIHSRIIKDAANPFWDFKHSRNNDHAEKLKALRAPVYMQEEYPDIPNSVRYPIEHITQKYGTYLTNSISFMIAMAIDLGFPEIHIYGVDMAQSEEYCVAPETRVLTADLRWIPVSEVQVGQKLIAFEEHSRVQSELEGRYRHWTSAVVESAKQLTRPCYRLHMADGTSLVASAEHRWLVHACNMHRWMETEKLQSAEVYPQRHSKIVKLLNVWDEDTSKGAGYLAGAFDGEGHITQKQLCNCASNTFLIGFAQRENGMSRTVEEELRKRGFDFGKNQRETCAKYELRGGRPEKLRFLGQIRPQRLLDNFDRDSIGITQSMENVAVLKAEYIGEQPVIGITTNTGTFIAEGFASHNSNQRPSCEFFLGWARALGIKIVLPAASDLMKEFYLYGYQQPEQTQLKVKLKARTQELQKRLNHNLNVMEELKAQTHQLRGALEDIKYMRGLTQ